MEENRLKNLSKLDTFSLTASENLMNIENSKMSKSKNIQSLYIILLATILWGKSQIVIVTLFFRISEKYNFTMVADFILINNWFQPLS